MVSFRGQKKLGPRPGRSPLGVLFQISDEYPHPFHMRGPPPGLFHFETFKPIRSIQTVVFCISPPLGNST